jgi:hypothetical protein
MSLVASAFMFQREGDHVQMRPCGCNYPRRISDSRGNPAAMFAAVDTAYTAVAAAETVVDKIVVGIEVEVLEMYIPWVESCSRSKEESR